MEIRPNEVCDKENLENAKEALKDFEREYGREEEEIQQQEREEEKGIFDQGELSGRYTAKALFGWSNKRYDREYWSRMDRNWRKWKGTKPLRQRRLETIREEQEEREAIGDYKGGKIEEWNKKEEMGNMGDPMYEL